MTNHVTKLCGAAILLIAFATLAADASPLLVNLPRRGATRPIHVHRTEGRPQSAGNPVAAAGSALSAYHRIQSTGGAPSELPTRHARVLFQMRDMFTKIFTPPATQITCDVCKIAMELLQSLIHNNATDDEIIDDVTELCVSLGIDAVDVCHGMLEEAIPEVVYIFKDLEDNMTKENMCAFIFGGDCIVLDDYLPTFDWTVTFPSPEPPYVPPTQPKDDAPKFRILHLSDVHLDPQYAEGTVANCDEPLCCRVESNPLPDEDIQYAGQWGGAVRNCDTPPSTLENLLDYVTKNLDFDVVYWTGDIPPHDVWNQTKQGNIDILKQTSDIFVKYLPNKNVFPAVGNHESEPVNSFPVPPVYDDYNISYLYTELDTAWNEFVPNLPDDLVLKGGYYYSVIRSGLKLISMNMNYCHSANWWLLVQNNDPTEEVQWLIDQLDQSEKIGQKVHIIGHIPPGQCEYVWSRNFRDILDRYKGTIAGHFYGHTHHDEFEIVYDDVNTSQPISFANIGPSVTTYGNNNPAFRIYTVDGDYENSTWTVLDYEEFYLDLDEANADGVPEWKLLYSAKDSYQLADYSPSEWDKFVTRMETDDDLFNLFMGHYYRETDGNVCDQKCKTDMLCGLRKGWAGYECQ